MIKNLKQNESGVVLVTVLMVIMIMMVLSVSILSMNVSQVMLNEGEVRHIQAEALSLGVLDYAFANQGSASPTNSITLPITLGNSTFNILTNLSGTSLAGYETTDLTITVDYN